MKLTISGIEGYDGSYDFDFEDFTNRELAEIEKIAGVALRKMEEGYFSIAVGVAVVVLRRTGKPIVEDMLWNAKQGSVLVQGDDAGPPEQSPTLSNDGETNNSASNASENGSASLADASKGSGDLGLETSVISDLETSAT